MGLFSDEHPYTAVTEYINRMTDRDHEEEDLSDLPELIEVVKMQSSGITESSRAIRKFHIYANGLHRFENMYTDGDVQARS